MGIILTRILISCFLAFILLLFLLIRLSRLASSRRLIDSILSTCQPVILSSPVILNSSVLLSSPVILITPVGFLYLYLLLGIPQSII